ncbi:MAG: XrtA system polysaccharide deacetylase [Candidatus Zixiibacteriota bacterium]
MPHAFTVDVEGMAESHAESVTVAPALLAADLNDREVEANLGPALDLLSATGRRATFFFLGRIARSAPRLVRRVAEAGHEIACHSLLHRRITGQTRDEFRRDLREAKSALEDAGSQPVIGFRAPDFSIGEANRWALDELWEAGFRYDSSIVPTSIHDVYGMKGIPESIFRWHNGLVEFPLPVVHLFGSALPIGGGGYFRLYPLAVTRVFFERCGRSRRPCVFYIHPYEIGPSAPRLTGLSMARRFRHYVRLHRGQERLASLLRTVPFDTMANVLRAAGFAEDLA